MIVLAIDIGLTGALAAVDSRGTSSVADLPLKADKSRICGRQLLDLVRSFVAPGEPALLVTEDVQPRPQGNSNRHGNSMHSQGSMMQSKGLVLAVSDIAKLELQLVHPQTWKKFYGLIGQEKAESMAMAKRLYPDADLRLVKHHNRAEALLIARFGMRKLGAA